MFEWVAPRVGLGFGRGASSAPGKTNGLFPRNLIRARDQRGGGAPDWCTDWPRGGGGRAGGWGQQATGRGRDAHGRAWQRGCHPARSESRAPRGGTVCMRRAMSMDGGTPAHTRTADASSSNPYVQSVYAVLSRQLGSPGEQPAAPCRAHRHPGLLGSGKGDPGWTRADPGPHPCRGADPIRML